MPAREQRVDPARPVVRNPETKRITGVVEEARDMPLDSDVPALVRGMRERGAAGCALAPVFRL